MRELRAGVRRAVLQAENLILPDHLVLDGPIHHSTRREITTCYRRLSWEGLSLKEIIRRSTVDVERRVLIGPQKNKGNKAEAARLLHIDYKTIHSKVKQYGIKLYPEEHNDQKE